MITEIATLNIMDKEAINFEKSFNKARKIISSSKGFIDVELQKCIEVENKYILIVRWKKLQNHTDGFRNSTAYQEWKKLLHHFYNPFPVVEHFTKIF